MSRINSTALAFSAALVFAAASTGAFAQARGGAGACESPHIDTEQAEENPYFLDGLLNLISECGLPNFRLPGLPDIGSIFRGAGDFFCNEILQGPLLGDQIRAINDGLANVYADRIGMLPEGVFRPTYNYASPAELRDILRSSGTSEEDIADILRNYGRGGGNGRRPPPNW